ncbi:hypothetical protein DSO57_1023308 [Entomophthora muscae]|uniref:Uncharacterized protein n=1 Tax=Entomophthora muscae TaxID=34485 RepID=A0ACC2SS38_9FUNG|nr:hypothetical protein DSO57_1023308 [Entomophthora muscae]
MAFKAQPASPAGVQPDSGMGHDNVPSSQDFSKLGFVYITVLGLVNQVLPHNESWHPLATAVNYIVRIAPIVYMAFQAQPASPVGVQLDSGMGCENMLVSEIQFTLFLSTIMMGHQF